MKTASTTGASIEPPGNAERLPSPECYFGQSPFVNEAGRLTLPTRTRSSPSKSSSPITHAVPLKDHRAVAADAECESEGGGGEASRATGGSDVEVEFQGGVIAEAPFAEMMWVFARDHLQL
jgi:hypothetical protein